jgi:hypothetical protein
MIGTRKTTKRTSERKALDRRVRKMYAWFNRGLPDRCFYLIDPKLIDQSRVELQGYGEGLLAFKEAYGTIRLFHIRISLHLDASTNKHDPRPFAYAYVTWQDEAHGFHMFRERWVKDAGKWYTRVAGLVPNKKQKS